MLEKILLTIPITFMPVSALNDTQTNNNVYNIQYKSSEVLYQESRKILGGTTHWDYETYNYNEQIEQNYNTQGVYISGKTLVKKRDRYTHTNTNQYNITDIYVGHIDIFKCTNIDSVEIVSLRPQNIWQTVPTLLDTNDWNLTQYAITLTETYFQDSFIEELLLMFNTNETTKVQYEDSLVLMQDTMEVMQYDSRLQLTNYYAISNHSYNDTISNNIQLDKYYIAAWQITYSHTEELQESTEFVKKTQQISFNYIPTSMGVINEVTFTPSTEGSLDLGQLILTVLSLPYAFIQKGLDVTLWPGTVFAINVSHIVLAILAAAFAMWIIKRFFK